MKISELEFNYPEHLVATSPIHPTRVMLVDGDEPVEIKKSDLIEKFKAGDILVINTTQVLKRRVFSANEDEILFLNSTDGFEWEVLFPAKAFKVGDEITLPGDVKMTLLEKGLPQKVKTNISLSEDYFLRFGEIPLPPYIQKARKERHNTSQEEAWYQTAWAEHAGSFAAPTASLHFKKEDIAALKNKGVQVVEVILHVGLGTFLPVKVSDLNNHKMHKEFCSISSKTLSAISKAKQNGNKIWSLGTTVTRTLESWAAGKLLENENGFAGETDLLIQPGFEFKVVDCLLTNFHQPQSTLLALVFAFAGAFKVRKCYDWAVAHEFLLFSYGDLSVWIKK